MSVGTEYKLSIKNVSKVFFTPKAEQVVLDDISIDVKENEFLVLLGPGQCGKTVLLNILAGLDTPSMGEVLVDGVPVKGITDQMSFVFQRVGLFDWKNATQNVELHEKYSNITAKVRQEHATQYLNLVGLSGFEKSYPRQLSGGMKQRVGIARAYNAQPQILLMDEPFGALDAQTRYSMQDEILRIWGQDKRTIVFVTNNIEEAIYLGDRIVLLSGKPAQAKETYSLKHLERPRDYMSKEFLQMRQRIEENFDLCL